MYILYFILIALIPIWAQFRVKRTYDKFSDVPYSTGMTGAEVARRILDENGLYHVKVLETEGFLSDHYNPITKTVHLSPNNYWGNSIAGASVAAHEVGHAIQDKVGYSFLRFRHALVPIANFSSSLSWIFIFIGMLTTMTKLFLLGIILMSAGVLFQVITLPVEFNASSRALKQLVSIGIIRNDEKREARKVLGAAAMTYVAAAAVAILELIRLILVFFGMQNNEDN